MANALRIKLSAKEVAEINRRLRELHDLIEPIAALRECGDDCQAFEDMRQQLTEQLTMLRERFG